MPPIFTVVIPTYNAAYELRGALASLAAQTVGLDKIQILVVDDGSIDNVAQVVAQFNGEHGGAATLVSKKNGGWGSVVNFVRDKRLAQGEYVSVLDADDRLHPRILERVQKVLGPDLIVCDFTKRRRRTGVCVHPYAMYVKRPKKPYEAQTPYCIPLGKFLRRELFEKLPALREGKHWQDALYTAHAVRLATEIFHLAKNAGDYRYKREGNSMSEPWNEARYKDEVRVCLDLLALDAQEVVAVHALRNKFRRMLKRRLFSFPIKRKFRFDFLPFGCRWGMRLMAATLLRACFRKEANGGS